MTKRSNNGKSVLTIMPFNGREKETPAGIYSPASVRARLHGFESGRILVLLQSHAQSTRARMQKAGTRPSTKTGTRQFVLQSRQSAAPVASLRFLTTQTKVARIEGLRDEGKSLGREASEYGQERHRVPILAGDENH